jgi:3-phenylpropionate/cinnamic acid dioxygenase small subunit
MNIKDLYEQLRDGKIISDIELQREIVYDTEKQVLVIDSIVNGIPLPAFYFWKNEDGILEVLDGKQRIEAIKKFIENDIQYQDILWKQTDKKIQGKINETELSIIICEGKEQLKREIFRRINTLGVPLSPYEVLNGLFHGEYLRGLTIYVGQDRDALKVLGSNSRGRNQYKILQLLMGLKNLSRDPLIINDYVSKNQKNSFADDQKEIGKYIKFVREIFDEYGQLDIYFNLARKYVKDSVIWKQNKDEINSRIKRYLKSDDAKLTEKPKEIEDIIQAIVNNISVDDKRLFSSDDKKEFLRKLKQNEEGKHQCAKCKKYFYKEELTMDHKDPWSKGGRTELSNAELLCRPCNIKKGNRS